MNQSERHADAGGAERPVPGGIRIHSPSGDERTEALVLRQEPGEQRSQERAEVDPHIEDGEAGVAADVIRTYSCPTITLMFGLSRPVPSTISTSPT